MKRTLGLCVWLGMLAGCSIESIIFPIWEEPFPLPGPPAELGPFAFQQRTVELADLGDGDPGGVTIFEPVGADGPRPALVWVLGVNNRAHFHQSFHEYMASWGYVDLIPATRDISFLDTQYHWRNTRNANHVFWLAATGQLGAATDTGRMAFGGYSVGGTMAAFAAASEPQARALLMWAPSPALLWQGVDPDEVLPGVTQPSLFLQAELDDVVGDWPDTMKGLMSGSAQTTEVIPQGVHLFFQQPTNVDNRNPPTTITRMEQMKAAFEISRAWLDQTLGIVR